MSTVRQPAAWTHRVLITLSAAIMVEVFAVGLGAFHAVNAFLAVGVALFLTARAWRGNLLIPPRTASAHRASTDARCAGAGAGPGTGR